MGQFSKRLGRRKPAALRVPKPVPARADADELLVDKGRAFVKRPDGSIALQLAWAGATLLERRARATPDHERRACVSGCAHCCYMPVTVSVPEGLLVRTYLRERWTADELAALREILAELVARQAELDDEQLFRAREGCVFLADDQRCRIYAARPLACRGHASFSREACAASFEDPDQDDQVPIDPQLREHKDKIKTTVGITSELGGCDALEYELHALVHALLERDDKQDLAAWLSSGRRLEQVRVLDISRAAHEDILALAQDVD